MLAHSIKDINYHDDIADDYDRTVVEPRLITNDFIYGKLARFVPAGFSMLDLGCGTGHFTCRFGDRFQKVTAVDHSRGMLNEAARKVRQRGFLDAEIVQSDAMEFLKTCKNQSFDLVGSVGFLHHLQSAEIKDVLANISRVLRPNGRAIFQEPVRIPPDSVPARINKWNSTSVVTRMQYCHNAPPPDEQPLEIGDFSKWLSTSGLNILHSMRTWEIFPQSHPAMIRDKVAIQLMVRWYRNFGNVFSVVAEKA
jgi:ubiquinone/menaquinone biosynthesis C-methylase UbiE